MTTDNPHLKECLFTPEQRRALAEVYRFLISLDRNEHQEAGDNTNVSKKPVVKNNEGITREATMEHSGRDSLVTTNPPTDNPIADQEALPQTEPARKSDNDAHPRNAYHHPAQSPES